MRKMEENRGKNKKNGFMREAWEKALKCFEEGQKHYRNGEYEKAVEYYNKAIKHYPATKENKAKDLSFVYFCKGEALRKLKKQDAALDNFGQCLTFTSEILEEAWHSREELYQIYQTAKGEYRTYEEEEDLESEVDMALDEQASSFGFVLYYISMFPWDLLRKVWLSKEEVYEELGLEDKEEEALDEVLQIDLRNLYFLKGRDRDIDAFHHYNSAMYWGSKFRGIGKIIEEISEKDWWWRSPLGKKYRFRARKYFYRALYNEGICLYELGHREKAALYFDRVREISPEKALKDQVKKLADRLGLELPELKPEIYPGDERGPEQEVYPPEEEIGLGDISLMEIWTKIDGGRWGRSDTCPLCGSTHIVTDYKRGETTCDECGLVIKEKFLERGDITGVSEEEKKRRVKLPVKREMRRIKRVEKWQKTSRERALAKGYIEINRLISIMGMPKTIKNEVDELYKKAVGGKLSRGRSRTLTVAALVYCACREQGHPRIIKEIVEGAGLAEKLGVKPMIARKKLASTSKSLSKKLHLRPKAQYPQSYISRFCSKLKLDVNVQTKANEILMQADEKGLTGGNPPLAAATAIYIASIVCNERRTQKQVASVAGVTDDAVIRKRYKKWIEELGLKKNIKNKKK